MKKILYVGFFTLLIGFTTLSAQAQSSASTYVYTQNLTIGTQGADVIALQQMLNTGGFLSVSPTGYFGSLTKIALSKWQMRVGISPASGYFGPLTRTYINNQSVQSPISLPPGCTPGAMFSTQTGAPCSSFPDAPTPIPTSSTLNCQNTQIYSSTTGQPVTNPIPAYCPNVVQNFSVSPTTGLAPLNVTFTANVPKISGNVSYGIDFGDTSGITSYSNIMTVRTATLSSDTNSILTETHAYKSAGTYTARLVEYTGCSSSCLLPGENYMSTVKTITVTVSSY